MRCKTIEKWLHWYGEGELSAEQKATVDAHVQSCESCRSLLVHIGRARDLIGDFRAEAPVPRDPEALAGDVVRAARQSREPGFVARGLFSLGRPGVRLALGGALVFILGSFFMEEIHIMNQISGLENKMKTETRLPQSAFVRCWVSAERIAGMLNGDSERLLEQARTGRLRFVPMARYMFEFQHMPAGDRMRVLRACRDVRKTVPDVMTRLDQKYIEIQ
ncbi:zf-HC2 domain-containing protein [bacterium]|nr:zf-HC2 domain-containing protein [bacterium]